MATVTNMLRYIMGKGWRPNGRHGHQSGSGGLAPWKLRGLPAASAWQEPQRQ
ncbi:Hypothetical protein SMAX5B_005406 [Scophthalmus maximus]|uniref:Uncharacterized protein n=1 Tax=Scophthalmus maximus TaxID=52904 RepID=A0A2U9B2E3_SCOMX|nr:Hypothetical protein SMAX5B_005406 [Scophthalmus maximus]